MENEILSLIAMCQKGDKDSLILLLQKFDPLLNKYSRMLNYKDGEDGKQDLVLELTTELVKCGDGAINIKFKDFSLTPCPQFTLVLEFKYENINKQGVKHAIYHTIEITLKDPEALRHIAEGIIILVAICGVVVATGSEVPVVVAAPGEAPFVTLPPKAIEVVEKAAEELAEAV